MNEMNEFIETACEVYRNELNEFVRILNVVGELNNVDSLGEIISIEGSVRDFKKALTEKCNK